MRTLAAVSIQSFLATLAVVYSRFSLFVQASFSSLIQEAMDSFRYKAVTELVVKKIEFEWTIQNFKLLKVKPKAELRSPDFHVNMDGKNMIWNLLLYPCGDQSEKLVAAYLAVDCFCAKVFANFQFLLENSLRERIMCSRSLSKQYSVGRNQGFGYSQLILRDELLSKLANDDLKFICKLEVCVNGHKIWSPTPLASQQPSLSLDGLWKDSEFSDVTISVNGTDFKAHKFVLAAKSPVFRAMFQHDFIEAKTNRVEIENIKPPIFTEFLNYMYTGRVDAPNDVGELLIAADEYNVEELKSICENIIIENMTILNCIENLILSDLHSAKKLKEETLKFIFDNAPALSSANGWDKLETTNPNLFDMVRVFLNRQPRKVVTEIPIAQLTFQWDIVNFSFATKGDFLTSPDFYEKGNEKWAIKIKDDSKDLSIFLELVSSYRREVKSKLHFSLRNILGKEIKAFVNDNFQTFNTNDLKMYGKENLILSGTIIDGLTEDTLRIVCTLEIMRETNLKLDFL